jgi:hypothetical protein
MKTFDLYRHPTRGYEAVKRGFSWPGFLIGAIWALSKRMWLGGGVLLVASTFLLAAHSDAEAKGDSGAALVLLLIQIALGVTVGIMGNARWSQSLTRRGYDHLGTGDADEPDAAIAAFVKKAAPASTNPTAE